MRKHLGVTAAVSAAALLGVVVVVGVARADDDDRRDDGHGAYQQTNLLSDLKGLAKRTDENLVNPWGIAWAPGKPLWVANNGSNTSTVYTLQNDNPSPPQLVVTIAEQDWAPTGVTWNPNPSDFGGATFIFCAETGKIVTWSGTANPIHDGKSTATVVKTVAGAIYKGMALATNEDGNFLFAANFHAGTVDVFDDKFDQVHKYPFTDRELPAGYAPFNVVAIDGALFVTYAKQDAAKEDDVPGLGFGFVNVFTTSGKLVRRFASRGKLDAPWGVTRAPANFGKFSDDILIGNFGNGQINVFDNHGNFLGELRGRNGKPIEIEGLWSLAIGTFKGANPDKVYFTAGIDDEKHGLLGDIKSVSSRY